MVLSIQGEHEDEGRARDPEDSTSNSLWISSCYNNVSSLSIFASYKDLTLGVSATCPAARLQSIKTNKHMAGPCILLPSRRVSS